MTLASLFFLFLLLFLEPDYYSLSVVWSHWPKMLEARAGFRYVTQSSLSAPHDEGILCKDLIIADLGTFRQPACVGPRQAPTVASWMDVTGNPLISEGHFLSQATATRAVSTGAGKVGQARTGAKPGRVCLEASVTHRDRYLLSVESDFGIISICLQLLKVMRSGPNHVIHRNLHR